VKGWSKRGYKASSLWAQRRWWNAGGKGITTDVHESDGVLKSGRATGVSSVTKSSDNGGVVASWSSYYKRRGAIGLAIDVSVGGKGNGPEVLANSLIFDWGDTRRRNLRNEQSCFLSRLPRLLRPPSPPLPPPCEPLRLILSS
jgi:hypothetical protein